MLKKIVHDDNIYTINIGRNCQENWALIDSAAINDIWFHLDGYPSPHVILQYVENIPDEIITKCCELCKKYSKYKNFPPKYLKVIITNIQNLKKGKDIGSVSYINIKKNRYIIL